MQSKIRSPVYRTCGLGICLGEFKRFLITVQDGSAQRCNFLWEVQKPLVQSPAIAAQNVRSAPIEVEAMKTPY
jgi:hypothetical protein